jgi:DNA-binding NarL/FixJ family response regulator
MPTIIIADRKPIRREGLAQIISQKTGYSALRTGFENLYETIQQTIYSVELVIISAGLTALGDFAGINSAQHILTNLGIPVLIITSMDAITVRRLAIRERIEHPIVMSDSASPSELIQTIEVAIKQSE